MEKALSKVGSLWISKKAKEELSTISRDLSMQNRGRMEKTLSKVGSLWISKKAKEEISTISHDLSSLSGAVEDKAKWVLNKLKGNKPTRPLQDILRDYNLPRGLFPSNIKCYELDEPRGKLVVHLPYPCEVCFKDTSLVRYATRVRATLTRGKLASMEGIKTKVVLVWVKVNSISVESHRSDKVWFGGGGGVKKSRSRDAYDVPRQGIKVEEF